jgi:hypothetical protein
MTYKIIFRTVSFSATAALMICAGCADFGPGGGNVNPDYGVNAYLSTFNPVLRVQVSPSIGGRVSVSPPPPNSDGTYRYGDVVTVKAVPNTGYAFEEWSGASADAGESVQIVMDGDKILIANFKPKD